MKRLENDCMGCATESYPCIGSLCKYRNFPHFYCDNCGEEFEGEELYKWNNGEDWCKECIFNDVEMDLEQAYSSLE